MLQKCPIIYFNEIVGRLMPPQIYKPVPNNGKLLKCLLSLWINSVFTRPGRFHFWIYTPSYSHLCWHPGGLALQPTWPTICGWMTAFLWHLSKARRILRRSIGLWRNNIWLVVSTPLKNISQLGLLFPIYGKIKNVPDHQPVVFHSENIEKRRLHFLKRKHMFT